MLIDVFEFACGVFESRLISRTNFQIFFVLRKKDSQVTFLHLYHHSLTPLETWICVKFIAGGHGTLGNLINNAVHVIMYTYYLVSAMGPEYQKYLWWKKHLTTVQLVGSSYSERSHLRNTIQCSLRNTIQRSLRQFLYHSQSLSHYSIDTLAGNDARIIQQKLR